MSWGKLMIDGLMQDTHLSVDLYTYCYNNPVNHVDPIGNIVDIIIDVGFTLWDIADVISNPSYRMAWAALGADAGCALIPFATGRRLVKVVNKTKNEASKVFRIEKKARQMLEGIFISWIK